MKTNNINNKNIVLRGDNNTTAHIKKDIFINTLANDVAKPVDYIGEILNSRIDNTGQPPVACDVNVINKSITDLNNKYFNSTPIQNLTNNFDSINQILVPVKPLSQNIKLNSHSDLVANQDKVITATKLLDQSHQIIFDFIPQANSTESLPVCAVLMQASRASMQTSAMIIDCLNALAQLQEKMISLVQSLVGFVSAFNSRIIQVYNNIVNIASTNNKYNVQDMPFVLGNSAATTMLNGLKSAWGGDISTYIKQQQPAASNTTETNPEYPAFPPANTSSETSAMYSDYWSNCGFASPTGLFELSNYFAINDVPDNVSDNNVPYTGKGIIEELAAGNAQTGKNISFVVSNSGTKYNTEDGQIPNSLQLPNEIFELLSPEKLSNQLVSLQPDPKKDGFFSRSEAKNVGGNIAYLNMGDILSVCQAIMTIASAFVPTQGYLQMFNTAFGDSASYKSLSQSMGAFGQIIPTISTAPNSAQQNAQVIVSAQNSLIQTIIDNILPNFRLGNL